MTTLKNPLLCALLALAAPGIVYAACGSAWPNRSQILEIRIDNCQAPQAFAAEAACLKATWLLRMQDDAVKKAAGLVIRGTVVQSQEITTYEDGTVLVDPPLPVGNAGVWFVPTSSGNPTSFSCPSAPEQTVLFVVWSPCCDSFPPGEFSCWFELKELAPASDSLKRKIGYR